MMINDGFKEHFSKEEKKLVKTTQSTKFRSPRQRMKRVLMYPRMHQNWNMFFSVIKYEKWVTADITFDNGEMISLFQTNEDIENKFDRRYFHPYNNQFWRKFFGRLGKSSYQRYIPKFKNWLTNTDYFPEYADRKVTNVKLWRLNEKSLDPGISKRPKVSKRELKKSQKGNRKGKKNPIKNNQKKSSRSKLKLK